MEESIMKTAHPKFVVIATLSFLAALALPAAAAVPDGINYQGYLTNADGTPVDASVSITFNVYNVDIGGEPLWSDTGLVIGDRGLFSRPIFLAGRSTSDCSSPARRCCRDGS